MAVVGGITGRSTTERLISLVSAANAKLLAALLVLSAIGYHGLLHLQYGSDTCGRLLTAGRYKGDHEWQPAGCMLHRYSRTDIRHCFHRRAFRGEHNHFMFVGDERVSELYHYFVGVVRPRGGSAPANVSDYVDEEFKLRVQYVWSPHVDGPMLRAFLAWERGDVAPDAVVAGAAGRGNGTTEVELEEWRANLTRLVRPAEALGARGAAVLWRPSDALDDAAARFNAAARTILAHSGISEWSASLLTSRGASLRDTALRHDAQLLLNMHCNRRMSFDDGSCCAAPEPITRLQLFAAAAFLICGVLCVAQTALSRAASPRLASPCHASPSHTSPRHASPHDICGSIPPQTALARLGLVTSYFFLCDRTDLFMKENKYYSEWSFWLPVGYVLALGLFFTDYSRSNKLLHRQQTSEWKGWMQLVVLVSQLTGAGKLLPIYMLVRAVVSAYLFLLGYAHVCSAANTSDVSLVRYLRVMFRLNFVTVVLCVTMNRPYQFYSFVPLVSFWFTMIFCVLSLPPRLGSSGGLPWLCVKLAVLVALVTVLFMSEVLFQKIFAWSAWRPLWADGSDDVHAWWVRWKQDRYSAAYGAAAAAAVIAARHHGLFDDSGRGDLLGGWRATLAAALALAAYAAATLVCDSASACDEVHSYAAVAPLLAYALLRNTSGALRTRHSTLLAWVGSVSLELYLSHTHVWLAADTHGVLVLVPYAPILNLLLTSYVFACCAHELRTLTLALAPVAVPADPRRAAAHALAFVAALVALHNYIH